MKLIVFNDRIIGNYKDASEVDVSPDCRVYWVPDTTVLEDVSNPRVPRFRRFSELGITKAESDKYEAQVKLRQSDTSMIRVIEDVIDLLIQKAGWTLSDLPERAQAEITERKNLRELYNLANNQTVSK